MGGHVSSDCCLGSLIKKPSGHRKMVAVHLLQAGACEQRRVHAARVSTLWAAICPWVYKWNRSMQKLRNGIGIAIGNGNGNGHALVFYANSIVSCCIANAFRSRLKPKKTELNASSSLQPSSKCQIHAASRMDMDNRIFVCQVLAATMLNNRLPSSGKS